MSVADPRVTLLDHRPYLFWAIYIRYMLVREHASVCTQIDNVDRCRHAMLISNLRNGLGSMVRHVSGLQSPGLSDTALGDVYSLMLGTKTLIVLSSDAAVKELLDRRSGTYSDRQEMYIGQVLCSDGLRMLMMVCGTLICRATYSS